MAGRVSDSPWLEPRAGLTPSRVAALITDFGTRDHYVGVVKGQLLKYCPGATVIDVTHEVPPYSIPAGAYALARALHYFPEGTLFLVVVDPGVGSERDVLLVETADVFVIAPHNGLLDDVLRREDVRGIWSLRKDIPSASSTFHARDLFAPLAGRLMAGEGVADYLSYQPAVAPFLARTGPVRPPEGPEGVLRGEVLWIDRYGNLVTNIKASELPVVPDLVGRVGAGEVRGIVRCYEEGSQETPFFILGSSDLVEISVRQGSAAEILRAEVGCCVELRLT